MATPHGTPIWYELTTPDVEGAQAFYTDVVGWSVAPSDMTDTGHYRIFTAPDGQGVGGMKTLAGDAPTDPGWYSYVGVRDVDAHADAATRLGGSIHVPPTDIPRLGRFAVIADPQGMTFSIMRADRPGGSQAFHATAPGHCGWNELVTSDQAAALDFYGTLFDWQNNETMAMGEMGDYCFIEHRGERIGAVMTAGAGWPTRWSYYFNVPSIAAAKDRVERGGGTVSQGPHEVPGGMFIIMGTDPQGVAFALVGGR